MQDKFDLNKLYHDYLENRVNNEETSKILISIFDIASSTEIVLEALKLIDKLSIKNKIIFQILENLLISDEDPKVRSQVASIIIKQYLQEAVSPLKWAIQTEKSSMVIKALFDSLENVDNELTRILKKSLLQSIFGVKEEEIPFFLELDSLCEEFKAMNIDFYKNFQTDNISSVKKGKAIYAIKKGNVVALNMYGWKTSFDSLLSKDYSKYRKVLPDINSLPESLTSLNHLEFLDLSNCSTIKYLPKNIGNLDHLKTLLLRDCYFLRELPDSIGKLRNLEVLELTNCYYLKSLPDTIINLCNLRVIKICGENYISLKYIPENIGKISNLEVLSLKGCALLEQLPESIGELTHLKQLDISYCKGLKELPESIKNLKSLKIIRASQKEILDYETEPFGVF